MEYERKDYFEESEADDVNGFVIVAVEDGRYHIAEKWFKESAEEGTWLDYWIDESALLGRVEDGKCSKRAQVTDEQFDGICRKIDWYENESKELSA
jgi:hypothetical protein